MTFCFRLAVDDALRVRQELGSWDCRLMQRGQESVQAASVAGEFVYRGWGHFQEAQDSGNGEVSY